MKRALLIPVLMICLVLPVPAHETDQFTVPPGREFADVGELLNQWFYDVIARAVKRVNTQIREVVDRQSDSSELKELQSPQHMTRTVNKEMPWAMDVIEGWEKRLQSDEVKIRYPGRVVAFKEPFANILQHTHFVLDPRQFFRLFLSSTLKAYGTYMGTDKIGHFTDMGMNYWNEYRKDLDEGTSDDEAMQRAVRMGTEGLIFSERGMLGYLTAGAYSNGDISANYLGFLFYRNLTEPMMLKAQLRPPLLVRDGPYWKIALYVKRDNDFFAVFISDHLDEALNPSKFETDMRDSVRHAVKARATAVLEHYCDEHGCRRTREYFNQKVGELSTYYGRDYGHNGRPEELVSIGNTCFESMDENGDVHARNALGETPLHLAAARDVSALSQLLARGANVNTAMRSNEACSADWGNTPLHLAARDGQLDAARALLSAGAQAMATNDRGVTPLHDAVRHPKLIELLIAAGAKPDAVDLRGQSPLHWAASTMPGFIDEAGITLLVQKGASPNARDHDGRTPLHLAAQTGDARVLAALLRKGADPNAVDKFRATPLHLAAARKAADAVEALLRAGASANLVDDFGCTPLHDAARVGADTVVALLLKAGASPASADQYGHQPIELARRYHHESVARPLSAGERIQPVAAGRRPGASAPPQDR